jgi:ATP-binding cassette subfamily F protein uup
MEMKSILVNAHKLEKNLSNRLLFKDISFGVHTGDRIGLLGPNGAGKSTLLRIIAQHMEPDSGNMTHKKGLKIGYLEQTPILNPKNSIMESILEKCVHKDDFYAQAYQLMAQLNLFQFGEDFIVGQLSGGWQKRVALARELILEPEVLLLDEPTNHLDVTSILWLEEFLVYAPFAVLMVTHDRLFLQRVANTIFDLDPRNPNYLLKIEGDYARYLETKELELAALKRQEQVQKNTLRRELEWLGRGAIARLKKQNARIESTLALKEDVAALSSKNQKSRIQIEFGEAENNPKKLIKADQICKSFGERIIFNDLDLLVSPKTRLGLLGENGTGKSTLIKCLIDLEKCDSGKIERADNLKFAYFEQGRETLDFKKTVLQNVCPEGDFVYFNGNHIHARSYLDRFLFRGTQPDLVVGKLSGGEQARLRIAQIMLTPCQVLILDEPTNDLDSDTLDVLKDALTNFNGAIVLVTHDRYFLDAVSNVILAFPPQELNINDGLLTTFASYFQWETWFFNEKSNRSGKKNNDSAKSSTPNSSVDSSVSTSATGGNTKSAPKGKLNNKERFEFDNMEKQILDLENKVKELEKITADPAVIKDHKKNTEAQLNLANTQHELEEKYKRWTELENRLNGLT